jgi:hypothetical protein
MLHRHRLLAVFALGGLVLAGCGNSGDDEEGAPATTAASGGSDSSATTAGDGEVVPVDAPGVTDTEIRFSAFGTNSNNPLGTCVLDCYVNGIEAYFAFRNSEGGVHGRQLVLSTILDDELANNQQRALDITSANDTFAAFSATQIPSGWATVSDAGMPLYTWSIHPQEMEGRENIFGYTGVLCTSCTSRVASYIASELAGATTTAHLGYGVSPNSQQCAAAGAEAVELYADETGLSVGFVDDNLDFGLPNGIGPQVTAMREAGVDFIYGCIDLNGMKTLAQELERQGMSDVTLFHPNTYDASFVAEAGDLFEGDYVQVAFRPFEADPGESQLADFQEWMAEVGAEITEISMIGWINADLAYQGLLAAGPDFSREAVIEATNQMTDYTAGGLIPTIDWSRQHQAPTQEDPATHGAPQECFAIVQVQGGEFQLVTDSEAPWFCWSNENRDWADPEPTNFE